MFVSENGQCDGSICRKQFDFVRILATGMPQQDLTAIKQDKVCRPDADDPEEQEKERN